MKITVNRYLSNADATLSDVMVNGDPECYGLEDEYREVKVANETRIPAGTYPIKLRAAGGMHGRYCEAEWCKDWHKGMLHLQDVPGFEWIYIHPGNTDDHTSGCLLVGDQANEGEHLTISKSRIAYERLYKKVVAALEGGELVEIEYIDSDREAEVA